MASAIASRNTRRLKIWKRGPTCCCAPRYVWLVSRANAPVTNEGRNMATTVKRLTYDDLEVIPRERPGDRHEIINGELVVTPSPIPIHQVISSNIEYALERLVRESGVGIVLHAPVDIRLTPDNVLIPDIIFIAH